MISSLIFVVAIHLIIESSHKVNCFRRHVSLKHEKFSIPFNNRIPQRRQLEQIVMSTQSTTKSIRPKPFLKNIVDTVCNPFQNIIKFIKSEVPVFQYIWPTGNPVLRIYLIISLISMYLGKYFIIKMPFVLQRAIDTATKAAGKGVEGSALAASASSILLFYALSRALSVTFAEIKTCLFSSVTQSALRRFAGQIFSHLHALDSDFHWRTPSGTVSVAYVRAIRGFQTMLFQLVFSVAPMALELGMVANILYSRFGMDFALITLATFLTYTLFTIWITEWRVSVRRELVDVDNARNGFFIDSILNHEVVKLFTSERREAARFEGYLRRIEDLNVQSTYSIAALNLGQALLFCSGLTANLLLALRRVTQGAMSVGDLVAVNGILLQLSIPFNYIGYTYQELRQAHVDMGFMRHVLLHVKPCIQESPDAPDISAIAPISGPSSIEFKDIYYSYSCDSENITSDVVSKKGTLSKDIRPSMGLLKGVSFKISPGQNAAIVGPSGSGKSTTLRLVTRMFKPDSGQVLLDGVDVSTVSMRSVRERVAIVPQDTSLFDETVEFNIRYGNPQASDAEVFHAIGLCNLNSTITRLSDGLGTRVGERGAKLSGGERQKVSIARAILKDPSLILCDEVTSAVDAFSEREIVNTLRQASGRRTTLTVAHRLSSIAHCDIIIVLEDGHVVEQGTHSDLLAKENGLYRRMWEAQNGGTMKEDNSSIPVAAVDEHSTMVDDKSCWWEGSEYMCRQAD